MSGEGIVSGTHLPVDALRYMPDNVYILAHWPAHYSLKGFRVVTIFRDPRNMLVSYIRHRAREGIRLDIPKALEGFWGQPFVQAYRSYLGWRGKSVVVRYEDLPHDVIGDGSGIYRGQPQDWNTRTGEPSNWREIWDDAAEMAWRAHGGMDLLREAGYD
jgi:hypothetical protein